MQGKMRHDLYVELYEVENTHWWHRHKRTTVHQMIATYVKKGKALDIGSGTGKILEELKERGWEAEGIDGAMEAVQWSKKRGITIKKADFVKHKMPYADNTFDLVMALDLLEHVPNDGEVLREMHRVTKPGGNAVVTVPAYQWMFNYWDEILGHQRRYTVALMKRKAMEADWNIKYSSYYFCLFLIPAMIVRFFKSMDMNNQKPQSDFQTTPIPWVSIPLMNIYAKFERWLLKYLSLPFGLSVIIVLKKRYN